MATRDSTNRYIMVALALALRWQRVSHSDLSIIAVILLVVL